MTWTNSDETVADAVDGDGIRNGLYSIHIRMLDGIDGGNTGVMVLDRYEVGIGFSGVYCSDGAAAEATALVGKRSFRVRAMLKFIAEL
jgi:hypothetical protein